MKYGIKCIDKCKSWGPEWQKTYRGYEAWCARHGEHIMHSNLNDVFVDFMRWSTRGDSSISYEVEEYK